MEYDRSSTSAQTRGESRGGQAKEQAKQQGQQFAGQARQQADKIATWGGEQVRVQLGNQKHNATQRIAPVQTALRETAHQLRKQGQNSAQYVDGATDRLERFSDYLRDTDVDEILGEVRGIARRRPTLFLGGAAALGFLATRFLKSSSQEQGGSAGEGYETTGTALSGAEVRYGTGEHATALPAGPAAGETPTTVRRTPSAGSLPTGADRTEPPREY